MVLVSPCDYHKLRQMRQKASSSKRAGNLLITDARSELRGRNEKTSGPVGLVHDAKQVLRAASDRLARDRKRALVLSRRSMSATAVSTASEPHRTDGSFAGLKSDHRAARDEILHRAYAISESEGHPADRELSNLVQAEAGTLGER